MESFFSKGDGFFILIKDYTQHNLVPKIIKLINSKNLKLFGVYFFDLPDNLKNKRELKISSSKIYKKHIRSGQVIENPGDVIIFGNVNQGAEIRAGGSIIVFGKARGILKAGLVEKKNVMIVAAQMETPVVEISGLILSNYAWPDGPIMVRLNGEKLIVEPLEV